MAEHALCVCVCDRHMFYMLVKHDTTAHFDGCPSAAVRGPMHHGGSEVGSRVRLCPSDLATRSKPVVTHTQTPPPRPHRADRTRVCVCERLCARVSTCAHVCVSALACCSRKKGLLA